MIDRLSFLPLDKVQNGIAYLKEIIPPHAEDLLFNFDQNYVNETHRCIETASSLHLRTIPRFPPLYMECTKNNFKCQ